MQRRYVVTGSGGQLGRCLVRSLSSPSPPARWDDGGCLVAAFAHADLDIADPDAVAQIFDGLEGGPPDVLVNAAAYNAVDACEGEGRVIAERVNGDAPRMLAEACARVGARFVHVSTDYVLQGDSPAALPENAAPAPTSAYGRSKLAGERGVLAASADALVVRTSWVFGPGKNFVGTMLRQARLRRSGDVAGPMRVVADQWGCPTYAADLADGIRGLVAATRPGDRNGGIYHLCNSLPAAQAGGTTWWDFARAILDAQGYEDIEIEKVSCANFHTAAKRPRYSLLGVERAASLGVQMRPWPLALAAFMASTDLSVTREMTDPDYVAERVRAEGGR